LKFVDDYVLLFTGFSEHQFKRKLNMPLSRKRRKRKRKKTWKKRKRKTM